VDAAVDIRVVDAVSCSHEPLFVVPRAAALSALLFFTSVTSLKFRTSPLINIPCRIKQPKRIGCKGAYWGSVLITVATITIITIGIIGANLITPPVFGLGTGTSGIFPLGFGRQTVLMASLLSQPLGVGGCIEPRHIDDWMVASSRTISKI